MRGCFKIGVDDYPVIGSTQYGEEASVDIELSSGVFYWRVRGEK